MSIIIISIEGLDGVGKTTLAKKISKENNMIFIDKPIKFLFGDKYKKNKNALNDIYNTMYDCKDEIIKTWFFGLGNLLAINENKNEDIILDRHILSNFYYNSDEKCFPIYDLIIKHIGCPDLTILLYADKKTRIQRIKKRNSNDLDLLDINDCRDFEVMIDFLEKYHMKYVIIDTSNKSCREVEKETIKIINNLKNKENG